jgi:predicted nuclease with TOPRIM domain
MADYDTQPTIETVLTEMRAGFTTVSARLAAIETRLDRLEEEMDGLHKKVDDLSRNNRRLEEKVNVFIEEVISLSRELHRKSA